MRLGRWIFIVGIALMTMSLTGLPVFATQGGNGNGNGQGNGQGAGHANGNSAIAEEIAAESSETPTTANSSEQVCDGDSGSNSDTGHGANQDDTYDNTCPNGPSGNGNGGGEGTPCAGCVGQADDKNPPGQEPGPQDHNNGYECDGNNGIAKTNPAHTGCPEDETEPTLAYSADVPPLACGTNSLTVTMTNLNDAAGGNRTFIVKLDGVTVDTEVLASGVSGSSVVTIPDDGATHSVTVQTGSVVIDSTTAKVETVCSLIGAAAAITDLPCDDSTADVTVRNLDGTGNRLFNATVDGASAGSAIVAAGSSATFAVNIPSDATDHAVAVSSGGSTLASKTLKVTSCSSTRVLGVQFSNVLGGALPRTGLSTEVLFIISLALVGIGIAMQVNERAPVRR